MCSKRSTLDRVIGGRTEYLMFMVACACEDRGSLRSWPRQICRAPPTKFTARKNAVGVVVCLGRSPQRPNARPLCVHDQWRHCAALQILGCWVRWASSQIWHRLGRNQALGIQIDGPSLLPAAVHPCHVVAWSRTGWARAALWGTSAKF